MELPEGDCKMYLGEGGKTLRFVCTKRQRKIIPMRKIRMEEMEKGTIGTPSSCGSVHLTMMDIRREIYPNAHKPKPQLRCQASDSFPSRKASVPRRIKERRRCQRKAAVFRRIRCSFLVIPHTSRLSKS